MSTDLENRFIAYLMHDTKYIAEVRDSLTKHHLPNTFSVYEIIVRYYVRYGGIIDEDYAVEFYKRRGFDTSVIVNFQTTMVAIAKYKHFDDAEFKSILDELDEQYRRFAIADMANKIISSNLQNLSDDKVKELQNDLQKQLMSLSIDRTNIQSATEISENVQERWEYYENIEKNPDQLTIYPTGFKGFDDKNGGLRPQELVYIIGRQGTGKSVLMLGLMHNFWKLGINCILFSLEISEADYMRRFDSRAARIPTNSLKRGTLTKDEKEVYSEYLQKTKEGLSLNNEKVGKFVVVDIPGKCSASLIEEKVKEMEQKHNCTFQIICSDYAGLMVSDVPQKELRHQKAQIALELKQLGRRLNKLIITGEQANRQSKNLKEADTTVIAESDQISSHIDWGWNIRSQSQENVVVESFKTRDGMPFKIYCRKRFDIMLFDELEEIAEWET